MLCLFYTSVIGEEDDDNNLSNHIKFNKKYQMLNIFRKEKYFSWQKLG